MSIRFYKYHALGNDYLVIESDLDLNEESIRAICDRHYGIGSDGILLATKVDERDKDMTAVAGLRIFNPDGSEAEKSGNGIRIFCRYLWDKGIVKTTPFFIQTKGGTVKCQMLNGGKQVFVEMGTAHLKAINTTDNPSLLRLINDEARTIHVVQVSIGNPHCVVFLEKNFSSEIALRLGPIIENHITFPGRTNVQFVHIESSEHIKIEIWERGAGYTLASGSSSCAAAAASVFVGLCKPGLIKVQMPGGNLMIDVTENYDLTMLGPVVKIADGELSSDFWAHQSEAFLS